MVKIFQKVSEIFAIIAALLLLFFAFSIGYSIFTRSMGFHSPVWIVQFNEYGLLWMTFLGTVWVLSTKKHVSIQLVSSRLSDKANKILNIIHALMGLGLCGVLCFYGVLTTWDHFQRHVIDVQPVDIPKAYVLVVIPLGFFLLTLQFIRNLFQGFRDFKSDPNNENDNRE